MISKADLDVMLWVVHDYRKLNENIIKDHISLTRQDEIIEVMIQAAIYDTINLSNTYYQTSIAEEDKHKIVFKTLFNMYK